MHQNKNFESKREKTREHANCCGGCSLSERKQSHRKNEPSKGTHVCEKCGMSGDISNICADMYRGNVNTDPQGSYTGRPADITDKPVQDADDL